MALSIIEGGKTLLGKQTVSGVTEVDFESMISSDFDYYLLTGENIVVSINDRDIHVRTSTDNGSTYDSTSYYGWLSGAYNSTVGTVSNAAQMFITHGIANTQSNNAAAHGRLEMFIDRPMDSSVRTNFSGRYTYNTNTAAIAPALANFSMTRNAAEAHNAIRIVPESGNISGTFKFYGVA
jgi:hypothetical protein